MSRMPIEAAIAKLRDPRTRYLDLSGKNYGPDEAKLIAEALPGSSLKWLTLSKNPIGDEGAIAIANALPKCVVSRVSLSSCGIGDKGMEALREGLAASGVATLTLTGHSAQISLAKACEAQVKENKSNVLNMLDKVIAGERLSSEDIVFCIRFANAALHFLTRQPYKLAPEVAQEKMLAVADQLYSDGQDPKSFALHFLPLASAYAWLKTKDIPLTMSDFLNSDGSVPQDRFLCIGGMPALFAQVDLWQSSSQFNTALRRLPPEQKEHIPNAHTLSARLRALGRAVSTGPEVG